MQEKKRKPFRLITRRRLLGLAACSIPAGCALDSLFLEPKWLSVKHWKKAENASVRLVHFTDLHYRGQDDYTEKVIKRINSLSPDIICFTGDLVEKTAHLKGALDHLSNLKAPLYAVPGNHDYWSGASFAEIGSFCAATGGAWLENNSVKIKSKNLSITGIYLKDRFLYRRGEENYSAPPTEPPAAEPNCSTILLAHHPETVKHLGGRKYDLVLAGHSHGGQVRLPFAGALIVPNGVGPYDKGRFSTPAGPLYVNPGIGTWHLPVRFLCRPELTVIDL